MTATDYVHYTCDHEAGMCDAELVIKATEHEFDVGVAFGRAGWTWHTSPGWITALTVQHFCPEHSEGAK